MAIDTVGIFGSGSSGGKKTDTGLLVITDPNGNHKVMINANQRGAIIKVHGENDKILLSVPP